MNRKVSKVLRIVSSVLNVKYRDLKKKYNKLPHNTKHSHLVNLAHMVNGKTAKKTSS